jgi:hypothetical protein
MVKAGNLATTIIGGQGVPKVCWVCAVLHCGHAWHPLVQATRATCEVGGVSHVWGWFSHGTTVCIGVAS